MTIVLPKYLVLTFFFKKNVNDDCGSFQMRRRCGNECHREEQVLEERLEGVDCRN